MNRWVGVGLVTLVMGCSKPEPVELQWLEGAGFGWRLFNHRLSHLEIRLDGEEAQVAVIGGTSTTGVGSDLDDSCEASACREFPLEDDADVALWVGRVEAPGLQVARKTASLVVGPQGAQTTLRVKLPAHDEGGTVAILDGLRLSTDVPLLGGDSCYRAKFGWLPRRFMVHLGTPERDGEELEIPVSAEFIAGLTLENERRCLDAVVEQAQIALDLDVLVVSAPGEAHAFDIEEAADFEYGSRGNPVVQEPPPLAELGISVEESLVGFSALDFDFHEEDPDERGAYLRTLHFHAAAGQVRGAATNYSPGTQLSGFNYRFRGVVRTLDLGAPVQRIQAEARLPAEVDEAGEPVVHAVSLQGSAGR